MFGLIHTARRIKQLAFKKRMVEHMQHAPGVTQRHQTRHIPSLPQHAHTKTNTGNADVFGAGITQQPFQVALAHGVQPANYRRRG